MIYRMSEEWIPDLTIRAYVEELRQVGGCGNCGHDDEVGGSGSGEGRGEECELHDSALVRLRTRLCGRRRDC